MTARRLQGRLLASGLALALAAGGCAPAATPDAGASVGVRQSPAGGPARAGPPTPPGREEGRFGLSRTDALAAIESGAGREALAFYEREAERLEGAGQRLEAALAHTAVSFTAPRLGEYQHGIRAGTRALELLRDAPRTVEVTAALVSASNSLGNSYRQVGDLPRARQTFESALELVQASPFKRRARFWIGSLSRGLASVAASQGDHATAVEQGARAVALLEQRVRSEKAVRPRRAARLHLAKALLLVGNAKRHLGRHAEAEATLRRAQQVSDAPEVKAQVVGALGQLARARGDRAGALEHFARALPEAQRLGRVGLLVSLHSEMGRIHLADRRWEEALREYSGAMRLVEDVRSELEESAYRSGYLEDKLGIYHGAARAALALGRSEEAFGFAERARARAFLDLLGTHTTLSKGKTRALVEEELRLRAQLAEARAAAADSEGGDEEDEAATDPTWARGRLAAAEASYRAFLDRVRGESREQASLMSVEPVNLAELQRLLPEGTVLLEYLVTEPETLLWIVTRTAVESLRLPVTRRFLVAVVRDLRTAIADNATLAEVQGRSRRLHDALLSAARPRIAGERLLIVPHDVLHYLPFAALRSPRGRWLIEDYTLATLPSASVLKYLEGKGGGREARTIAVGNPDLGPALSLRYAEREARAVGAHFPGASILVRAEATEARVKTLAGGGTLLHFATHGALDEQDPLASALLLAPEGAEDGRLEVREVFGLDLGARLVVLSACETGLGRLSRGDELVGLQRAFLYAGTPAVITTLWKIDDRASFALMEHFYHALERVGPAQALRQAGRATLAEHPHPFAWAAFVLTGVPD
ncbi:MAG: CHAT domain-containing protein [Candidatus Rokubacteria bacterium]|nr:CHAT domain-containing protein [Candidatus Rokubacteria bacterium]